MPTYKVTLVRRTLDYCDVEVEAESDEGRVRGIPCREVSVDVVGDHCRRHPYDGTGEYRRYLSHPDREREKDQCRERGDEEHDIGVREESRSDEEAGGEHLQDA